MPSSVLTTYSYLVTLKLEKLCSLRETMEIAVSFETVMGFVLGWRPKLPVFRIQSQLFGIKEIGELEVGYHQYQETASNPNYYDAVHLRGIDSMTSLRYFVKLLPKYYCSKRNNTLH